MGSDGEGTSVSKGSFDAALFDIVASSASDGIVSIDVNSTIRFVNPATGRIFGYRPEDLIGRSLTMLMPDYLRRLHEAAIDRYIATGEKHLHWGGVDLPGLHASGREIPLEVSFGEAVAGDGRIFTGVIRDVSERKRVESRWEAQYEVAQILASGEDLEEAAKEILEKFSECLDYKVGIFWKTSEGGSLSFATAWHEAGLDMEPFLAASRDTEFTVGRGLPGRVARSHEPAWLPDLDVDEDYPRLPSARKAGLRAAFAFPILSGEELIGVMEFYSSEVREPDPALLNMVKSTGVQIGEFVERRRAQVRLLELNHELERRVAERTAELQSSNDELESFVYSVSHDLRAPLRGIDGFSQLLHEDFGDELGTSGYAYVQRIQQAAERMGNLIDDLLDLSRITRSVPERVTTDIGAIVWDVAEELRRQHPGRAVDFDIAADMRAKADPQLLGIVFENLLGNSWKFTSKEQRPRIEVGCLDEPGGTVFFVRDNGAGFDMRYADKLFRPFQRLHSPHEFEGTGIGLSIVQRIIQRHGGSIWVEAEPGKGASFYFTLADGAS